jgi:hypothetical protein
VDEAGVDDVDMFKGAEAGRETKVYPIKCQRNKPQIEG